MVTKQEEISFKAYNFIYELQQKSLEREEMSRLVVLAFLSSKHMFLIGKPGVGKTFIISKLKNVLKDAKVFEYLLAKDTKPEEIYGHNYTDDSGQIHHYTEVSIIDANLLILDEMFKASSGLLNNMLGALSQNRNFFLRGLGEVKLPLISAFVLSNEFPQDETLDPFDDRLHFRYEVKRLKKDINFKKMITKDYDRTNTFSMNFTYKELVLLRKEFQKVSFPEEVLNFFAILKNNIVRNELNISDRKLDDATEIFQASAYLNNRLTIDYSDIFLMMHLGWRNYVERKKLHQIIYDTFFQKKETINKNLIMFQERLSEINSYCTGNVKPFVEDRIVFDFENNDDLAKYNNYVDFYISVLEALKSLEESVVKEKRTYEFAIYIEKLVEENMFLKNYKNQTFTEEYLNDFFNLVKTLTNTKKYYFSFIESNGKKKNLIKKESN